MRISANISVGDLLPVSPVSFRVAFFNIYVGLQAGAKRAAIEAHIDRVQPDILGLAELTNADTDTVQGTFGTSRGYEYFVVGEQGSNVELAILSKFPIIDSGTVTPSPGYQEFNRHPLWAIINVGGSRRVLIYCMHPTSWCLSAPCENIARPSLECPRAVEWIRVKQHAAAKVAANPTLEVMAMGDFNDDDESPQTDAFASKPSGSPPIAPDITFPLQYATYPDYQCSQMGLTALKSTNLDGERYTIWGTDPNPALTIPIKIDFIAHSDGITVTGHEVLDSEATQTGGLVKYGSALSFDSSRDASDHKLVFGDFRI